MQSIDTSPFRGAKKVASQVPTQRMDGKDVTPIKGRVDPNMAHHARQHMMQKQPQMAQMSHMSMQELLMHKQEVSKDS